MRITLPFLLLVFLFFESAVAQTSKNFFTYGLTVGANRPQTAILSGDQKFAEQILPSTDLIYNIPEWCIQKYR